MGVKEITVTRAAYLCRHCPDANRPEMPIVNSFGEETINKCYLCSPHLTISFCGREFQGVEGVVEIHDRKRSLIRILRYLAEQGAKVSAEKLDYLVEIYDKLDEEYWIPHSEPSKDYPVSPVSQSTVSIRKLRSRAKREKKYMRVRDRKRNTSPNSEFLGYRGANWEAIDMYCGKKKVSRRNVSRENADHLIRIIEGS